MQKMKTIADRDSKSVNDPDTSMFLLPAVAGKRHLPQQPQHSPIPEVENPQNVAENYEDIIEDADDGGVIDDEGDGDDGDDNDDGNNDDGDNDNGDNDDDDEKLSTGDTAAKSYNYDDDDIDGQREMKQQQQHVEEQRPLDVDAGPPETMMVSALPLTPVYQQRLQHLADKCVEWNRRSGSSLRANDTSTTISAVIGDNLFVNDRLRFVYCLVPKVACTTWSRVLLIAAGAYAGLLPNNLPQTLVNAERLFGSTLIR
jgi:Sulfotransferase family